MMNLIEKQKYEFIHSHKHGFGLGLRQINFIKSDESEFCVEFRQILSREEVHSCLDIATGGGTVLDFAAEYVDRAVGIDISEAAIDKVNPKHEKYVMSVCDMRGFSDHSFDFVFFLDGLEHIPAEEEQKAMSECFRVASQFVAFEIGCVPAADDALLTSNGMSPLHINLKSPQEWCDLLTAVGIQHGFKLRHFSGHYDSKCALFIFEANKE
jgi:SAM-dependent methyltransferase